MHSSWCSGCYCHHHRRSLCCKWPAELHLGKSTWREKTQQLKRGDVLKIKSQAFLDFLGTMKYKRDSKLGFWFGYLLENQNKEILFSFHSLSLHSTHSHFTEYIYLPSYTDYSGLFAFCRLPTHSYSKLFSQKTFLIYKINFFSFSLFV